MTEGRRRWAVFAAVLPVTTISLVNLARNRANLAGMWPVWRPVLLDLALLLAGAVAAAGVAFGIHAWRQAKRDGHA